MPARAVLLATSCLLLSCTSAGAARPMTPPAPAHPTPAHPTPSGPSPDAGAVAPQASWVVLPCEPDGARPPSSFDQLQPDPSKLWTLDVRFDPRANDWLPADRLPMPWHHASRIEWVDDPPHDELSGARERLLRIEFVVLERELVRSVHTGVQVDATYRLDVVAVCEP